MKSILWFFDFLASLYMTLSGDPPVFPFNVAAISLKPPFTPAAEHMIHFTSLGAFLAHFWELTHFCLRKQRGCNAFTVFPPPYPAIRKV